MPRDARVLLPLKPLVFQVLLALSGRERHGWALVQVLREGVGGERILPGNFYRTLRAMLTEGLIDEVDPRAATKARAVADTGGNAERRRYFRLTPFGLDVARAEASRLEALVDESRARRLLKTTSSAAVRKP